jgi:hypothetical protein
MAMVQLVIVVMVRDHCDLILGGNEMEERRDDGSCVRVQATSLMACAEALLLAVQDVRGNRDAHGSHEDL